MCRHLILGQLRAKNLENLKLKLSAQKEKDGPDFELNAIVNFHFVKIVLAN